MRLSVAVVGAGWAGLAAAVRLVEAGHQVTVFEMASGPGGRARTVRQQGAVFDNGQHILIGAYTRTLALMRTVGVQQESVLLRQPLSLAGPQGQGFALAAGPIWWALPRAVLSQGRWPLKARLSLLAQALGWVMAGFDADEDLTVAALCARVAPEPMREVLEPLCVAALNTSAQAASARVFLRVLRDALTSGPGASDLLLPRHPLGDLLPQPAWDWLAAQGAQLRPRSRVGALKAAGGAPPGDTAGYAKDRSAGHSTAAPVANATGSPVSRSTDPPSSAWQLDGQTFDRVVLACTAPEAARLTQGVAPAWAARARGFVYEPIVTVYLQADGASFPQPMVSFPAGPAQFAFDLGRLAGQQGRFAFVISAAAHWVEAGMPAAEGAVLRQAREQVGGAAWQTAHVLASICEKRATFACRPGLERPQAVIAPGLRAAGDYVAGPYPATLEGAVRSGEAAAAGL